MATDSPHLLVVLGALIGLLRERRATRMLDLAPPFRRWRRCYSVLLLSAAIPAVAFALGASVVTRNQGALSVGGMATLLPEAARIAALGVASRALFRLGGMQVGFFLLVAGVLPCLATAPWALDLLGVSSDVRLSAASLTCTMGWILSSILIVFGSNRPIQEDG